MQGKPRDYQEPGSPLETGTRRAEPISVTQKMWESERGGEDISTSPFSLLSNLLSVPSTEQIQPWARAHGT